jgi:alpha-1,2-mannosyltransferase
MKANAWVRSYGPAVLVLALVAYAGMYVRWPSLAGQVDLLVYRFGALRVLAGQDLYSIGLTGNPHTLLFDYTPFAALCSLPLTFVSTVMAQVLGLVVNVALVIYAVRRMLTRLGMAASAGLWSLGALLVGLVLWLEPVRLSLQLGQVNLVILAVVVADLLGPDKRKWAGVGIGVVAGIKLTPALFIVYLILLGRRRPAVMASLTFAATVLIGFAVLPKGSEYFWLRGGFHDVARITSDPVANTSLKGLFVRLHIVGAPTIVATALLAVVALTIAVLAWRHGQHVLGLAIVGMSSAALSPFSWSHHWVWVTPLLVHLGHRAYVLGSRWSLVAMWAFWVTFAGWVVSAKGDTPETGLLAFRRGGAWDVVVPAAYLVAFAGVLVCTAWWLRGGQERSDPGNVRGGQERSDPGNVRGGQERSDPGNVRRPSYETGTTTGDVLYPVTRTQSAETERPSTDARSSTVSPGKTVT